MQYLKNRILKKKQKKVKNMDLRCYRYNISYILFYNIMRCRSKILIKKLVKKMRNLCSKKIMNGNKKVENEGVIIVIK